MFIRKLCVAFLFTPHSCLTTKSETFCYSIDSMYVLCINCVNNLRVFEPHLDTGIKEISIVLSRLLTEQSAKEYKISVVSA